MGHAPESSPRGRGRKAVAFGWSEDVAVTAGVNRYELKEGGHDTVASVGLRVGSMVIGGLFYVTALVFTSAR